MIKHKYLILIGVICIGIIISSDPHISNVSTSESTLDEPPNSCDTNYDLIENVLNTKLVQYASQGYFDQIYESSIQATYYALAILENLGKLTEVSFSEVTNFLMTYYNSSTKIFMDEYTKRYLDTNYSLCEFPLTSLLLTNCYAVLTLKLIGNLNLIDTMAMINFIWSCYNPETSGFIGVPYSIGLSSEWRVSTMDNTYYAVLTYDSLSNNDWSARTTQKSAIIDFIESLQDMLRGGGFHNDLDPDWQSLELDEPNIFASYFCIKTLDVFSWIPAVNIPAFHNYLESLYQPADFYFESMRYPNIRNKTNVVTTALGLALCLLTANESFININEVIDFILTHRNPEGGFYRSSTYTPYELLDLYQIICGLKDAGELAHLSLTDKQDIASFLSLYQQKDNGYSPISTNYLGISLLHSIIGSFNLFEQENELPIQTLYELITSNYAEYRGVCGFNVNKAATTFRIYPIDYLCIGTRQLFPEIILPESHYSTYLSLISLKQLRKLNDFTVTHNLQLFSDSVIQSQFLEGAYSQNFGAFNYFSNPLSPTIKNELIALRYSYYAIKILELIANELNLGAITSLGFDVDALDTYILRHIITTSTEQYVTDGILISPESILEQTYYAAYILTNINRNSLDLPKIVHFIENTINYSNIKNIYYCFKLSKLLNLDFNFDILQVHDLIQAIYSTEYQEFYITGDQIELCQEVLLYIAEMAKTDKIRIIASYPSEVALGDSITFEVNLANLVLKDFGPYTTVKIESDQVGTDIMDIQPDLSFKANIHIPAVVTNFPSIIGEIVVYEGSLKLTTASFEVFTTYETFTDLEVFQTAIKISFSLNASLSFITGIQPILEGDAFIRVYKNHLFIDQKSFLENINLHHTIFSLDYYPSIEGAYRIEIYFMDGINLMPQKIAEMNYTCTDPDITGGYRLESYEFIGLLIPLCAIPAVAIVFSYKERLNPLSNTQNKTDSKLSKFSSKFKNLIKKQTSN